jgi:hypothetical protein
VRRLWRDYSLSLVLGLLFLCSWIGQLVTNWQEFADDQAAHGQPAQFGGDFLAFFWGRTFENWQSEFLQLFSFVVLTAYLIHRGSHESKDGNERIERRLARIEEHLRERSEDRDADR